MIVLMLVAVLAFSLYTYGKKEIESESIADELQTQTEYVTEVPEGIAETSNNSAASIDETVEKTEATAEKKDNTADNAEVVEESKQTESPIDEKGNIRDTFLDENVNLGVAKGDGSGGDIIVDDSNPPAQNRPTESAPLPENDGVTDTVTLTMPITEITFEIYNTMSASQQQAVVDSFGSMEDFVVWFNYIKSQYKIENPEIEVGLDGVVDFSK